MDNLTLSLAFAAGLISFLSPCVLPIIPGFLSYLAGSSVSGSEKNRFSIFLNSFFFVLGFVIVFAVLGIMLETVLSSVAFTAQLWLSRFGGVVVMVFGLYLMGFFHFSFLQKEHRFKVKRFSSRYFTSFLFGLAFAVGWTPCVGAVLGAILGLAITQPEAAFYLLFAYALGLGLPFLLVGLFVSQAAGFIQKYGRYFSYLNKLFGAILVILGILVFTQKLGAISNLDSASALLGL